MSRHFFASLSIKAVRIIPAILCAIVIFGTFDHAEARKRLCAGDDATLGCLKQNFDELHEKALFQFMIIIGAAEQKATACTTPADTVAFLEVARLIKDNMEVRDYFHDIIETTFLRKNPECLLDALTRVDEESRRVIVEYLQKPSFVKKAEVDSILSKFREKEKYRDILRPFFPE